MQEIACLGEPLTAAKLADQWKGEWDDGHQGQEGIEVHDTTRVSTASFSSEQEGHLQDVSMKLSPLAETSDDQVQPQEQT